MTGTQPLQAVVTLGTDHHRFHRLLDWLESWNDRNPAAIEWTVQHGESRPMRGGTGFAMKPRPELLELLSTTDLVVTQGGPGGIMDSRGCGVLPIVVPRLASLDEVVDDHQVAFAEQLASKNLVVLAQTEAELHAVLDRALSNPRDFKAEVDPSGVAETVARFETAVEELVAAKPPRSRRGI